MDLWYKQKAESEGTEHWLLELKIRNQIRQQAKGLKY